MDCLRALLASGLLLLALVLSPSAISAQTVNINGRFDGTLKFSPPCPNEGGEPRFSGKVGNGRISGRAARGQTFDWALTADGSFAGEMPLRQHRLGTKIQRYKGRVTNDAVQVAATFLVPGHPDTECKAAARLPLTAGR